MLEILRWNNLRTLPVYGIINAKICNCSLFGSDSAKGLQRATKTEEADIMKHVKTLNNKTLKESMKKGGCGECQTSCQSACKTSCTVGNQSCENANR